MVKCPRPSPSALPSAVGLPQVLFASLLWRLSTRYNNLNPLARAMPEAIEGELLDVRASDYLSAQGLGAKNLTKSLRWPYQHDSFIRRLLRRAAWQPNDPEHYPPLILTRCSLRSKLKLCSQIHANDSSPITPAQMVSFDSR